MSNIIKSTKKKNQIHNFFIKEILTFGLILLELLIFFHFKDASGNLGNSNGVTIAEYMRLYGGRQFFLAAYIQKFIFVALSIYPVVVLILWFKKYKSFAGYLHAKLFIFPWKSLCVNFASFVLLLIFFLKIDDPARLIANPFEAPAIFYTAIPLVWLFFLYSALDLLFPLSVLWDLIKNDKFFAILLLIFTALSAHPSVNPIHFQVAIDFWSNLLLGPTVILASNIADALGLPMQAFSMPGNLSPIFGTDKFHVIISPDCSGYEGITLIVILLVSYSYHQRSILRFTRLFMLIPIAIIGMFFLNALRLVILIVIGHFYSADVALDGFHTVGGWFNLFIVLVLSLWALNRFSYFLKDGNPQVKQCRKFSDIPFLLPLMALITGSLLTKAFTVDFQWLYPIPILMSSYFIYCFGKQFKEILIKPSFLSLFIGVVVFIIWVYLVPVDNAKNLDFLSNMQSVPISIALLWLLCRIFGASIVVPIAEELAFRGYLLPRIEIWCESFFKRNTLLKFSLRQIYFISALLSLVITSVLFGVLHSDILAGSLAGFGFGVAFLVRRKLVDAIVAHALTNALLAMDVIYFGNWSYW